jgi:hypothetical protein
LIWHPFKQLTLNDEAHNFLDRLARNMFEDVQQLGAVMTGFPHPWFISGGWAIDLFLQRETRSHSDLEVGIYRRDQLALQNHLRRWTVGKCAPLGDKFEWTDWQPQEFVELPIHQLRASSKQPAFEFEIFLNECTQQYWWSRRHPGLQRPLDQIVIISFLNIPVLLPEIQLLFKAKHTRDKDTADFKIAFPQMSKPQQQWLVLALLQHHPGHPWLTDYGNHG